MMGIWEKTLGILPKHTRASTAHKNKRNNSLLRSTYRKIDTNPNLQHTINILRSQYTKENWEKSKVLNFVQMLSISWKAKNAKKFYSLKWKNEKMHSKLCFL